MIVPEWTVSLNSPGWPFAGETLPLWGDILKILLLSFVIFREIPGVLFFIALAVMIAGTWMVNKE